MIRQHPRTLAVLIGIVGLLLAICSDSRTQERSLFSGRVVDEEGKPLTGIRIALMPVEDGDGAWFTAPVHENSHWADDPRAFAAVTDADGNFSITDFEPGPVLLGLLPLYEPPADVLHVDIRGFILYASGLPGDRGIVFVPEPGERIENVEITVRQMLRIQGKVRRVDGKPLVSADIKLRLQLLSLDDGSKSNRSWTIQTDVKGEFVQLVSRWTTHAPAYYTVSATYQGQRAKAKPILLKPDALSFSPVLKFTMPLMPPLSGNASRRHRASASVSPGLDPHGVWIINPGNGHAYKKIQCSGPEDAIFQASGEGAYLVSINDEAEQKWLERVFPPYQMLIGLNDVAKEGEWRWHSGEPVTYTNWARHEPHDTDRGDEDYVIWRHKWEDIGPEQVPWQILRTALIEKEGD